MALHFLRFQRKRVWVKTWVHMNVLFIICTSCDKNYFESNAPGVEFGSSSSRDRTCKEKSDQTCSVCGRHLGLLLVAPQCVLLLLRFFLIYLIKLRVFPFLHFSSTSTLDVLYSYFCLLILHIFFNNKSLHPIYFRWRPG